MWGEQDPNREIPKSTLFPINTLSLSTLAFFPFSLPLKCTNQILEFSLVFELKISPHFPTISDGYSDGLITLKTRLSPGRNKASN
jgi:hypothetical protein